MASKTDNATVELRINQVLKMIVNGADRQTIIQYASKSDPDKGKEDWGVSDRTVDTYIARANEEIEKHSETIRERELGKAMLRLQNLYARNMQINDFKAALATQKEIHALLGLYAPTRQEIITWETQAIEDIKAGRLDYGAMVDTFKDESLVQRLFREAGVSVNVGD